MPAVLVLENPSSNFLVADHATDQRLSFLCTPEGMLLGTTIRAGRVTSGTV
jgi:hypothetical protein